MVKRSRLSRSGNVGRKTRLAQTPDDEMSSRMDKIEDEIYNLEEDIKDLQNESSMLEDMTASEWEIFKSDHDLKKGRDF